MDYETLAVLAGIPDNDAYGAVGLPIYPIAAYQFEDMEDGAERFATGKGYTYARIQNPTVEGLEKRLAALEGAEGAVALASGQAASFSAILALVKTGDEIIASPNLFGGTVGLLNQVFGLMGIKVHFVPGEVEAVKAVMNEKTKVVFSELLSNPSLELPDLEGLAKLCEEERVVLIVDSTFAGVGAISKPLEWGAHVVMHSLTKWASGGGSVLGGAVMSRPTDVWKEFPQFFVPDVNGKVSYEQNGSKCYLERVRQIGLSLGGMVLSPFNAYEIFRGLETTKLRMEKASATAMEVSAWLAQQPAIEWVLYPGLEGDPSYERAKKYLTGNFGSMVSFGVKGGIKGASQFFKHLKIMHAPNVGDSRSLVVHPWTTTHGRITEDARRRAGVKPEMVRFSIGLESPEDLKTMLGDALAFVVPEISK